MEGQFLEFAARVMGVGRDQIDMGTTYRGFEAWDSLMMLTLVMEAEAEYGVSISIEAVEGIRTLADLFALVS